MRPTRDQWAMSLVHETARRSTCCRRNVGCVILNGRGHVISTGYNGVAAGLPHCNEEGYEVMHVDSPLVYKDPTGIYRLKETDKPLETYGVREEDRRYTAGIRVVHPNACSGAKSPSGTNLDGCEAIHAEQNALLQCKDMHDIHTVYVSASPCVTCTKLLLNTSCQRIVFSEEYPHERAKIMWVKAGRDWIHFDNKGVNSCLQL